MNGFRRRSRRSLILAGAGLLLAVGAFIIETLMGGGNGHRYLAVHIAQLVGVLLILAAAVSR